jgi:hypothetical protein
MSILLTYDVNKKIDKYNGGYLYSPVVFVYRDNRLAYVKKVPTKNEYTTINGCLEAGKQFCLEERQRLFKSPNSGKIKITPFTQVRLDKYQGDREYKRGALRAVHY